MDSQNPTPYTGPSAASMISNHTLAEEIISRANDSSPLLDANELALLKQFCSQPTSLEHKKTLLETTGMADQADDKAGDKAHAKGSLVGYIIAQSVRGKELLDEGEVERLRVWFGL
jgi:hypothetical protein